MVILLDFLSDLPPLSLAFYFFFFFLDGGRCQTEGIQVSVTSLLNPWKQSSLMLPNSSPLFYALSPPSCKGVGQWSFPLSTPLNFVYISLASRVLLISPMV